MKLEPKEISSRRKIPKLAGTSLRSQGFVWFFFVYTNFFCNYRTFCKLFAFEWKKRTVVKITCNMLKNFICVENKFYKQKELNKFYVKKFIPKDSRRISHRTEGRRFVPQVRAVFYFYLSKVIF